MTCMRTRPVLGFDDMIVPFFRWCSLNIRLVKNTKRVDSVLSESLFVGRWLDLLDDGGEASHDKNHYNAEARDDSVDGCLNLDR